MQPIWRPFARFALIAALGLPAAALSAHSAQAQGKLDATYTASLAGIPLGKGAWVVDVGDEQFTAATSGVTTGLLRVFASGQGSGISRGYVSNGTLIPASYAATITASKKTEDLRMTLVGGVIKDLSIEPPSPPQPERIPVTEAHLRGVIDPMTGSLLRVSGTGDVMVPEACGGRTVAIFDGRMRYDLAFAFKRLEFGQGGKGLCRSRAGLRGLFQAGCRLHSGPAGDQIPDRAARHGSVAGADRRHAHPGAVSRNHPDPDGNRGAAGQSVHCYGRSAAPDPDEHQRAVSLTRRARFAVKKCDPARVFALNSKGVRSPRRR